MPLLNGASMVMGFKKFTLFCNINVHDLLLMLAEMSLRK